MIAAVEEDQSLIDESSEDSLEELKELESKLYSVIHYNDLSEIVPSDLPNGYEIDLDKSSNEIIVSVKNEIKSVNYKMNDELIISKKHQPSEESCNINMNANILNTTNNLLFNNDGSLTKINMVSVECSDKIKNSNNDDDITIIETPTSRSSVTRNKNESLNLVKNDTTVCIDLEDKNDSISEESVVLVNNHTRSSTVDSQEIERFHVESNKTKNQNEFLSSSKLNHQEKSNVEIFIVSSEEENSKEEANNCSLDKSSKVKIKKKKRLEKLCPKKWTQSMVKFYTKTSRKKLNFDSVKLIKKMRETSVSSHWFVNNRDLNRHMYSPRRQRCRRCRQYDHDTRDCKEAIKPIVCFMCGEIGHRENRCPDKKCLTCGRPSGVFIQMCTRCTKDIWNKKMHCSVCYSNNHNEDLCPDVWRGFHITTKTGPLVIPLNQNHLKKYCCNCGKSGHLHNECLEINDSMYISDNPVVKNYVSVAKIFASNCDSLSIILRLNPEEEGVLESINGNDFLQNLSNVTETRLELVVNKPNRFLKVFGTQSQCRAVIDSVYSFLLENIPNNVSFHKHKKKQSPCKKQKIT